MAEKALYPSLSEDGWITSPERTADYLFSNFFVADYSQTYMYPGMIASLPWILQSTQGDTSEAMREIRRTLNAYFSHYFESVEVNVDEVPNEEQPSKVHLSLYVKFIDNSGQERVLGKILRLNDTIVEKIIEINNG